MVEQATSRYTVAWVTNFSELPKAEWDELALSLKTPFLEWDWLHNMETSGSVAPNTGWLPHHLVVWKERSLVAAAPLYLKGHSYGEFVFDYQWAEISQRLGIQYYPKMLGMSPFTPAEGYRFLIAPGEDEDELTAIMVHAIDEFCDRNNISGCNFLYVDPDWKPIMERNGFTTWLHHSYIWSNHGYQTFDDYLADFNANQRRNIKRERKALTKAGLEMRMLTGDEVTTAMLSLMYDFYSDTCDKFGWWGSKYLTRKFFESLHSTYRHRVVLAAAYSEQDPRKPQGMSFCLTKGEQLYGRYWGSFQEFDCLHFNACYYAPIEWAIAHGVKTFDPGAGGRHKKRRGFPAQPNYSLHRFYNDRLLHILRSYILEVNEMEQREMQSINQDLPFKQSQ
jgi:predicted N-acyltransferase